MDLKKGDFIGFEDEFICDDERLSRIEDEIYLTHGDKLEVSLGGTEDTKYFQNCPFCFGNGYLPDGNICDTCDGGGDRIGYFIIQKINDISSMEIIDEESDFL